MTVPELHVLVLAATTAPRRGRIIRVGTRHFFPAGGGADNSGGSEFAAGTRAATVLVVGELAGDFRREVAEEMGHGDEAGADDAGGDFGDAVSSAINRVGQPMKNDVSDGEGLFRVTYVHMATGNR